MSMSTELQTLPGSTVRDTLESNRNPSLLAGSVQVEIEIPSLPPTDHGKQAYVVLIGCTLIQAPIWGYSLSFGVFQEYYTTHANFKTSPGAIATVGTTLNGILYLMMPVSFTILTRYPRIRPYCGPAGLAITVCSLILSSFATQIWQLILSQGVLCAIGSGLIYSPTTLYLDEWFISRKGFAYGTIGAGKSASGIVFPFIMSTLLTRYGPKVTLQAWAVALILLTSPLLCFLRPRLPVSNSVARRPISFQFLTYPTFWIMQVGSIIQSFGYLLPNTYLASYAHSLGFPPITGAMLLAIFSLTSALGSITHGILQDHLSSTTVTLISSLGSTLSIFLFWGLARHIALLVVFAILYGFFSGGFSSTYPGIVKELERAFEGVDTGLVMGLLLGGRGVGFVIGGPVSALLLHAGQSWQKGDWGYGTEYAPVILCTGVSALLGSWGWWYKAIRRVGSH